MTSAQLDNLVQISIHFRSYRYEKLRKDNCYTRILVAVAKSC